MKLKDLLKGKSTISGLDIAEVKGKAKRVNLAIHSPDLLLHIIAIPKVKEEEIQSVLESKVNQYAAFAGVKTVIGWEKLDEISEAGEKKLRMLLAAAKKDLVDSHIAAIEKAGLQIEAITFPCLAVLELLKQTSLKSNPLENKILVDLDDQQTFILLLKGGAINFVHQGNLKDLTDDLLKILQREPCLPAGREKISTIVLHSQTQPTDDLVKRLSKELNQSITLELNMVAKGLALLKKPKINLLPWEVKRAEEWRQHISYFLFSILGLSLFMLILFFLLYLGSFILNKKIEAVQTELDKPTEQFIQLKTIEDKTKEIKNLLEGRKRIKEKYRGFSLDHIFKDLTELVPANVYLTRVEVNQEESMLINGVTSSSGHIFNFVKKLKGAKHFKNVNLQVVREAEENDGMTEFSIYVERLIVE